VTVSVATPTKLDATRSGVVLRRRRRNPVTKPKAGRGVDPDQRRESVEIGLDDVHDTVELRELLEGATDVPQVCGRDAREIRGRPRPCSVLGRSLDRSVSLADIDREDR